MRGGSVVISLVLALVPAVEAQEARSAPARHVTVTVGVGNAMGWLGGQGEIYVDRRRLSAFGGVGVTPEFDDGDPTGATFAAGIRGYTSGARHRGFLELSLSQVAIQSPTTLAMGDVLETVEGKRLYGPGLQAGYQLVTGGGFTVMASVGAGWAPGVDDAVDESEIQPLLNIGLGYTWR